MAFSNCNLVLIELQKSIDFTNNLEMGLDYTKGKMGTAVSELATGTGNNQDRLYSAYVSFHRLTEKDFPEELRGDWKKIHETLTTEESSFSQNTKLTTGTVKSTLNKMTIEKAVEVAKLICSLNSRLYSGDCI